MIKGFILGIFIYSLILTIVTLYKDNSEYFSVEDLDIIVAGPVAWILILFFILIKKVLKTVNYTPKKKQRKERDLKYITKVVRKIVKNYSKKKYHSDFFDFNMCFGVFNCNDIEGWKKLEVLRARNERINKKFDDLMHKQHDETVLELKKYFVKVNENTMRAMGYSDYWIEHHKYDDIYIIKSEFVQ